MKTKSVRISDESQSMLRTIKFMLSKNGAKPLLESKLITEEEALNLTSTKIMETSLFFMMHFLIVGVKKQNG